MHRPPKLYPSHLFTVRLWREELGDGESEWRGEVKNVTSGEQHYFREWPTLVRIMQGLCATLDARRLPLDEE